jgi:general secretion pathway protein D
MTRRIVLVLLASGACLIAFTNPCVAATSSSSSTSSTSPEQAAREEIVRRQEAQITARKLIDAGEKLYYAGKYQDAVAKLEEAVKVLPRAKATEIDYSRALQGLTASYSRLADAAFQAGDYTKARELAQKALEYDPKNRAAENVIIKTKKVASMPTGTAPQSSVAATSSVSGPALDQTPEFLARKDQIKKLFREGKILMNSGQYDEAQRRFQQILLLDPYNADARTLLHQLDSALNDIAIGARDESREHRLLEVNEAWITPSKGEAQPPPTDKDIGVIGREALRQQGIVRKLNEIIVPEINYREAVVSDVITFLSDESRRLDPEHVGVNIVLGGGIASPTAPAAPPAAPPPAPGAAPEAGLPGAGNGAEVEGRKITLSLRNVPLIDALKYVTTLANLKYRIESSAVIVLPIDAPSGEMVTRIYPVNPGAFSATVDITNYTAVTTQTQQTGGGGGGASQASPAVQTGPASVLPQVSIIVTTNTIRDMFTEAGVLFPTNSSIYYNARTSILVVHNTLENLEDFERVLATFNSIPPQVEIEAKFVEISQNDLDELGFDWQLGTTQLGSFDATGGNGTGSFPPGSGTPGSYDVTTGLRDSTAIQGNAVEALLAASGFGTAASSSDQIGTIRGILTNPQFQVIIKALSQKQSADVLTSPKVVTISGQQAQIRVAQEFIYPTTFSTATIQQGQAANSVVGSTPATIVPSTPTAFATRPVGVVFNVTPFVGADGYTISLTLIPQVTDFLGFINYGNAINLGTITTPNDIKEPLFSTRDLITSVVIWDGQTVVLGGLITEQLQKIDDKVPFLGDIPMLGRLFRTKTTQRNKTDLLIFVTARLIDPAGNPVHRTPITASAR